MQAMATNDATPIATGVPGVDDILAGGYASNRVHLVEGRPGSGKTTLGLQFLLDGLRQGERCLYITLSESKRELLSVAERHGWSLDGLEIYEPSRPLWWTSQSTMATRSAPCACCAWRAAIATLLKKQETHRLRTFGMVAWRAHGPRKRRELCPPSPPIDSLRRGADSPQRGFEGAGRHARVGIDLHKPLARRGRDDRLDVRLRVGEGDRFGLGAQRLLTDEAGEALVLQRALGRRECGPAARGVPSAPDERAQPGGQEGGSACGHITSGCDGLRRRCPDFPSIVSQPCSFQCKSFSVRHCSFT